MGYQEGNDRARWRPFVEQMFILCFLSIAMRSRLILKHIATGLVQYYIAFLVGLVNIIKDGLD